MIYTFSMFKVYKIINNVNALVYIGFTQQILKMRLKAHIDKALRTNDQCRFLQAVKDIGGENFSIELIQEYNTHKEMAAGEIYWIKQYDSRNVEKGYNTMPGGLGGPTNLGKKFSEEHKLKMSKSMVGKEYLSKRKFSMEIEKEICDKYINGYSFYKLGKEYDAYRSLIITIINRNNITHRKSNYTKNMCKDKDVKLKKELEIYNLFLTGNYTKEELAEQFNCCSVTIKNIIKRNQNNILPKIRNIFSKEEELNICELYNNGNYSIKLLSEQFNCCKTSVREIILRNGYKL